MEQTNMNHAMQQDQIIMSAASGGISGHYGPVSRRLIDKYMTLKKEATQLITKIEDSTAQLVNDMMNC
jgi:hypothetical protein